MRPSLPLLAGLLLVAATPAAADERELMVALQPGLALDRVDSRHAVGGGGAVDVAYGVADALWLRATAQATVHALPASSSAPGGAVACWFAGAGLGYSIDIIRFVPSLEFAVGLLGARTPQAGGARVQNELGLQFGLAFDYLLSRRFTVGATIRYTAALSAPEDIPLYLFVGPRLTARFGG